MEDTRSDADNGNRQREFKTLRQKAKQVIDELGAPGSLGDGLDCRELLEELNVYHIELEIQNEELLKTRDQLEANREYLQNLFKLSPVGYMVLTHEGIIEDINETASQYFDLKREILVGNRLHAFIPHDNYVDFATCFTRVVEKKAVQRTEVQFRVKDRHQFWARLDLFQSFHPVEERPIVLCAIIDISKEKAAEEILRNAKEKLSGMVAEQTRELQKINRLLMAEKEMLVESEHRFKETADLLPTIICELDLKHRINYVNEAGKAMLGIDPMDGTADLSLLSRLHAEDRRRAERYFRQILGGVPPDPEEFRVSALGQELVFLVKSAPMRMNGVIVGSRCSLADVTALKQIQNRLFQAQKMESMATLAGGIAHEFNNALTTVLGNASLIEMSQPEVPDGERKYLNAIKTAAEHMAELTKHLLAYARGGKYMIRQIDINRLITDVLNIVRHNFANPFSIQTSLGSGLPRIQGDAAQLDMLLLALLTNASEACEDTQPIRIQTEFRSIEERIAKLKPGMPPGDYVVLTVRDEGCGMTQTTLSKIFEPFYTTKFQGRGLGMAAAYGIVKNHHGWIGVTSQPAKGTTVEVFLPVSPTAAARRNPEGGAPQAPTGP